VAGGFAEIVNYSFIAPAWDRLNLAEDDCRRQNVRILNPLAEDQSVMRTSLVPSMLESVARNNAYRSLDLRLFELRPVFQPEAGEELPRETMHLCAAICGRREPLGWGQTADNVDFFDLKGQLESLLDSFRVGPVSWDSSESEAFYHPGKSCVLRHAKGQLGSLGEIHPQVLEHFEIDQPVYLLDIDVTAFAAAMAAGHDFQAISRFPDVCRDSALLVDEEVSAEQLFAVIDKAKGRFVEDYTLFDIYRGTGIPQGKKSLAIRVRYRSTEKTLTEEEITAGHQRIVKALMKQLNAEIR
jgi:phenylalanyl-tRNA synthetase beta chain